VTERVRVDRYVGSRIRLQRISLGMTDEHLAEMIGVSAAEMEHYEEGALRVPPSLLLDVANALSVGISYFFADLTRSDR
jgi:transcriptional regulator with XRE-family HTH domain